MKLVVAALMSSAVLVLQHVPAQAMPASPSPHQVFRPALNTSFGSAIDVDFGDLDGDGRADLLLTRPGGLARRLGLGAGAFGAEVALPSSAGLAAIELHDLDGDATPDLVAVALGRDGFVRFALGDGAGGFGAPTDFSHPTLTTLDFVSILAGDADGDGDLDVGVCSRPFFAGDDGNYLALYVNDGAGAVAEQLLDESLVQFSWLHPADFNGDSLPDVLLTGWKPLGPVADHAVFLGQPGGGFVAGPSFETNFVIDLVTDLDADGNADLVLGRNLGVSTWLGHGDATFTHVADTATGFSAISLDAADFDDDGNLDLLAVRSGTAEAVLLSGAGDGNLALETGVSIAPSGDFMLQGARVVDLDGDGGLDIAAGRGPMDTGTFDRVAAVRNATYPAGGPLEDWGGVRKGAGGYPVQLVTGSLLAGTPVLFELDLARANAFAWEVIGADAIFAPFKGGVIVPQPDIVSGPWPTGPSGSVDVSLTWPAGLPTGQTFNLQWWIPDSFGFKGFGASGSAHLVQP